MKRISRRALLRVACLLALGSVWAMTSGCDDDRPDVDDPPDGMGRLVIDNRSPEKLHVYFDGEPAGDVSDGKYRTFDLPPGEVHVTLDQSHTDRLARFDVDVLRGRIVIAEVENSYSFYGRLDVFVYLD